MMPRTKEPVDVIIAKNKKHLTAQEIEARKEAELEAPNTNINAPDYLTAKQKKRFNELVAQLQSIGPNGIIADVDAGVLGRYVVAEDGYAKITKRVRKLMTGDYEIDRGLVSLLNAQDKLYKQCRAGAADLGLSITSRCRISLPGCNSESAPKENPFAAFVVPEEDGRITPSITEEE